MQNTNFQKMKKVILSLIGFACLSVSTLHAQQGKNGALVVNAANTIVNEYTSLTANVAAGSTSITVANSTLNANGRFATSLQPGDLVMVYQVQGVFFLGSAFVGGPTDTTWGKIPNSWDYRQCGLYEYAQVLSVPNATTINLTCGLQNSYNFNLTPAAPFTMIEKAVVVRVPRYTSLTINSGGVLTCDDWNGTIGGILAVEVQGNTVINAGGSINATGRGFRGGSLVGDNVTNFGVNTAFSTNNTLGAEKGEGVGGYQSELDFWGGRYCRAPAVNGGGGGDAHNAGGGGGANAPNSTSATAVWSGNGVPDQSGLNWTTAWSIEPPAGTMNLRTNANSAGGGRGGYTFSGSNQNAIAVPPGNGAWSGDARNHQSTGLGGRPLMNTGGRVYFGGGGGAGDQNQNFGGNGGDGGGLVFIMCFGTISGAGTVVSNGNNGVDATGPPPNASSYGGADGAGGGGAGGSILLNAVGGVSGLTANANGGNGGSQTLTRGAFYFGAINEAEGPGGGGGGGFIAVSAGAITRTTNGGNNGITNSDALTEFTPNGATRGAPGTNNASITNWNIVAPADQTICAGQSLNLTAVVSGTTPVGYTAIWYADSTSGTTLGTGLTYNTGPLPVGTHTFWVGTCPGWWRDVVIITVGPPPTTTATATSSSICNGQSTTLNGGGATTYTWMPGSLTGTSVVVSPTTTTTYTVTGATGSCTSTAQVTVTVNNLPTVTASAASTTICAGQSTNLTGGGANTYLWNPGATAGSPISVTPAATTTYTVTGTNTTTGCTNTAQVTVNVNSLPTVTASAASASLCAGQSTNLTGSGANTYLWNPGATTGSPISVTPASTTTYTVTGTNTTTGCTNTAQVTVTVNNLPTVTASASSATICNGQSTNLTGSGANTYTWNPGALTGTTVSVSPTATTTYTVTGTNTTTGCTNTAQVTVTVNGLPNVTASAASSTICAGQSTNLTGAGANTYTWNPGALTGTTVSVTPASTTTYTVVGTNTTTGCTNSAQVTVNVNGLPTVTSSAASSAICTGQSTNLTGGGANTYTWNPGSLTGSPVSVSPATTTTYTVVGTNTTTGCTNTSQVTVTVNTLPTVTASASSATICNGQSTNLTGGGANTYTWNPGSLSGSPVTVSPSSNTTYTVVGTNTTTGCTNTAQVAVTVNPSPTVTATSSAPAICIGQSATLTGTGAVSYVWNPGSLTGSPITVSPITNTTYTVVGTGANGCTSSGQVTVSVNPVPVVAASPAGGSICAGSNISVTMSGANSYSWNPGSLTGTTQVLSPSSTTTYTVIGSNASGCNDTLQFTVTVNSVPVVTASTTSSAICAGGSATLTASGSNTYIWQPGNISGSSISVSPGTTTTYTVTGTDASGCSDTDQLTVTVNPLPIVTVAATPNVICEGQSISLSAGGGATYIWNGGNLSAATGPTQTDSPTVSATYTVVVTTSSGCVDSATSSVTVNPNPVAIAGVDQSLCAGGSVTLTGSGGGTYVWNGGNLVNAAGASQTDSPSATSDYILQVTDGNGCTDNDTLTVTVNALPVVTAGNDVQICLNSSAQLNASGASTYVWTPATALSDDSIANPIANPLVNTTYVVTGTDANGCVDTDTITVTIGSNLTVFASNDITICPGDTAQLTVSGGSIWSWGPSTTLDAPNAQTTNAFPTSTTTYTVNVSDANGCQGVDSVTVFINSAVGLTATGSATICIGQTATLSATPSGGTGPYTYVWDNSLTGTGPQIVSPTTTTVYNVYVTDAIGCNSSVQTMTVTVNPPLTLSAISAAAVCAGNSTTLTASGSGGDNNLLYTWLPGNLTGASQTVSPASTTTYTVILSDGCNTPPDTQTVTVTVNPLPVVALTADVTSGCGPLCVNFNANSSANCASSAWQFGDGNTSSAPTPSNCYQLPGTYDVTYTCTDANGCVGTSTTTSMITVDPTPVASFAVTPSGTIQVEQSGTQVCVTDLSSGAVTWNWLLVEPNGSQTSTLPSPCFTITDTGNYTVTLIVRNIGGCLDTATMVFNAENPCTDLFVPSAFSPNGDNQNDILFVYGSCINFMQFEIYNRWGERVFITTNPSNGWDGTWRGQPCESAVFTYVLTGQMLDGTPIEMQGNISLIK
jgi:gliding motility-associated-like protein